MSLKSETATFEEVKEAEKNPNVMVIDVRESSEIQETGILPGSINIPLGTLENTFKKMSEEEFTRLYERTKPSKDFSIIFSCKSGRRAKAATDILNQLGFKNARYYPGSWQEWASKCH